MEVDKEKALRVLEEEAEYASSSSASKDWEERVRSLTTTCGDRSKTFIAMLGTALLARATNLKIDPFALKAGIGPRGYSARSLAKDVLAAHALRLEIDLGVTGREPLNNQPFFAEDRVHGEMPVKGNAREAFELLLDDLKAIERIDSEREARLALRAFLQVQKKKRVKRKIATQAGDDLNLEDLVELIESFVGADSELGKRAQAVAAGLLDVVAGKELVMVSRIHDPDARFPCDVGIRSSQVFDGLERTFEVRDKPVSAEDAYHVVQKVADAGVFKVGMLALASKQPALDLGNLLEWARARGVWFAIYFGWAEFVRECLFWSKLSAEGVVGLAYRAIHARMVEMEVSEGGVRLWEKGTARSLAG